jgi:hypothetical protein
VRHTNALDSRWRRFSMRVAKSRRLALWQATDRLDLTDALVNHTVVLAGCHLQFCLLRACEDAQDDTSRSDRCGAHGNLLCHMGLFVLQHPQVAFSGGAIDRLLERLLLLLKLCCASDDHASYRQTRNDLGQIPPTEYVQAVLLQI